MNNGIIEGMQILEQYVDYPHVNYVGAEHDEICWFGTNKPISTKDLNRLHELGWEQPNLVGHDYNVEETWVFRV